MPNSETKPITLLFDLETTPLNAKRTEIHCIVTLDYETGETTRYNDIGGDEPIVRAVTYLMEADTIIGHNIIGFDIPVIKKIYPFFEILCAPLLAKGDVLNSEIQLLTSLRDALLPRLISGELRVPDAEKMLEEAGV